MHERRVNGRDAASSARIARADRELEGRPLRSELSLAAGALPALFPQGAELDRPSTLYARVEGSADAVELVEVGGSAVIVARGEFRL